MQIIKGTYADAIVYPDFPPHLCYLTGAYREKYLHDMEICQQYADLNRKTMASSIVKNLFDKE